MEAGSVGDGLGRAYPVAGGYLWVSCNILEYLNREGGQSTKLPLGYFSNCFLNALVMQQPAAVCSTCVPLLGFGMVEGDGISLNRIVT